MTTPWCARARQSADSGSLACRVSRTCLPPPTSPLYQSVSIDTATRSTPRSRTYALQLLEALTGRCAVKTGPCGRILWLTTADRSPTVHLVAVGRVCLCVSACMSVSLLESCHCVRACVVAAAQSASVDRGCESRDFHPPNWASSRHRSAGKF